MPAVDGRALPEPLPGVDPALYRRSQGREVLAGEVGCALSHLRALRAFLATGGATDLVSALLDPAG